MKVGWLNSELQNIELSDILYEFGTHLDPKLFAMINNDAWLINSSFQGGDPAVVSLVFKKFIEKIVKQKPELQDDEAIKKIQNAVNQIYGNALLIKTVIVQGKLLEDSTGIKKAVVDVKKQEQERLEKIKKLADDFLKKIKEQFKLGESCYIPGGFHKHAILYEFRKNINGKINLIVYNTGAGLEYHEHQTTFKYDVFKQKSFPAYVYEFAAEEIDNSEFKDYLALLLKAYIASCWEKISNAPEIETVAQKVNAEDLYQRILPLIIHLGGKRVDPKLIMPDSLSFITGQRSGKCSEAIFHPLLRVVFNDEIKYQRFMCAYRKATIASFVAQQEYNLTDPVINRQIRMAITNLSSRVYKHRNCFSDNEISEINKFVDNIEHKLNLAVNSFGTLSKSNLDLKEPEISADSLVVSRSYFSLPSIERGTVSTLKVANVSEVMDSLSKSASSRTLDLIYCTQEDHAEILMNKLNLVLAQIRLLSENKSHPREIIAIIEKILWTWPIEGQYFVNNHEEQIDFLDKIVQLISIYCQQTLLQFGMDVDRRYPILSAKHIMTIISTLTMIVQAATTSQMSDSIKQFIIAIGMDKFLLENQYNPYLASYEFNCDLRFNQLLKFFKELSTKKTTKVKDVYINFIEQQSLLFKKLLLEVYAKAINNICEKHNISIDALSKLNESGKCLLVLNNCRVELQAIADEDFQQALKMFDYLVNVERVLENVCEILNKGIKRQTISLNLTSSDLKFYPKDQHSPDCYWVLELPVLLVIALSEHALKKSVQLCSDERLTDFLSLDINKFRSLLGFKNLSTSYQHVFQSSYIQTNGYSATNTELTLEGFHIHQFHHTRASIDEQFFATINFFQDNLELLSQSKWQMVCALNLFQPNILLKVLTEHANAINILYGFLEKGLILNSKDDSINEVGLFLVKMQILVVNYSLEYKKTYNLTYEDDYNKLISLNKKLEHFLNKSKDQQLTTLLYDLRILLLGYAIPLETDKTQQQQFIIEYLQAKLQGSKELLMKKDPHYFFIIENIQVHLKNILLSNQDVIMDCCKKFLLDKNILSQEIVDSKLEFLYAYPSLFYRYVDQKQQQQIVVVNLVTGRVLKNNKEYLPLPQEIFNNQQFQGLFEEKVHFAFHGMAVRDNEPSIFEINFNNIDYIIKKTTTGYCFYKEFARKFDSSKSLYKLMSYQELKSLHGVIPKTLMDETHHFWMKINDPKELLIESKSTHQIVAKLIEHEHLVGVVKGNEYKIFTQQQVKDSCFNEVFSKFEDPRFIEVREILNSDGNEHNPKYIIDLPRYGLHFEATSLNPLTVYSKSEPKGKLLLNESWNSLVNIENALFIEGESLEKTVILPRQYFIADDLNESPKSELNQSLKFEYTALCLDRQNTHQNLICHNAISDIATQYYGQSKFLKFKLSGNELVAKDSADGLYLAYVYLANFDPWSAFKVLEECEKSGGLNCTQQEMEHLMLLLSKLPAIKHDFEDIESKKINTPEFLAVKAYAIYLYASSKHKQVEIGKVVDDTEDGKLFHLETKDFLEEQLDTEIKLIIYKYQQNKNNIPSALKLTIQEELECLRLISDQFLELPQKKLLITGLLQEQQSAITLDHRSAQVKAESVSEKLLAQEVLVEDSAYLDKKKHKTYFFINYDLESDKQKEEKEMLSVWINPKTHKIEYQTVLAIPELNVSTVKKDASASKQIRRKKAGPSKYDSDSEEDQASKEKQTEQMVTVLNYEQFKNFYFGDPQVKRSIDQLKVDLDEKNFFKSFITYFYIAVSSDEKDDLADYKGKLKEFLSNKLKIIANGHPIIGQKLMIILYQILDGKLSDLQDLQDFLVQVRSSHFYDGSYNSVIIGYQFDFNKFYNYLMKTLGKDSNAKLPILIEAQGIKKENHKKVLFSTFLKYGEKEFTKLVVPDKTMVKKYIYPDSIDILKKYNLLKPVNMLDDLNVEEFNNFVKQYKEVAFLEQKKINKIKQELALHKEKIGFEKAAEEELSFEQRIGKLQNDLHRDQLKIANKFLNNSALRENLRKKIDEFIYKSNTSKKELQQSILSILNEGPSSSAQKSLHNLSLQAKIHQPITEEMALNLYLLGDEKSFIEATGLSSDKAEKAYCLITEYLAITVYEQQLQTISNEFVRIEELIDNPKELPFAFKNLADLVVAENLVDPNKHPEALAVFQFCRKILLRQEQIDYLLPNIQLIDGKYQDLMSQLIMGFGKTFLLPIIAKAKANGTNLSVIEVPESLFETNLIDLHNVSMRFLHQKTQGFRFNRSTPCTVKYLMDLYEWLVGIKQNRDYLVTTGETVASVNLRYLETLKLIADYKDVSLLKRNEVTLLEDLKEQAYWLEKIVKLFKFEADVIIDEVHAGLDVRKKLIYSTGTGKIASEEINGILTLYKFLLPLKVFPIQEEPEFTIQDIIKNPGILGASNDDDWKKIMEISADCLIAQDSTIQLALSALLKALNTQEQHAPQLSYQDLSSIIKNYLLNKLSSNEYERLPLILDQLNDHIKDLLALYKVELTRLLPSTLKKTNRKHYGLLETEYLLEQPMAVPFIASDSPHILSKKDGKIRTTTFANPDETINYTIQAYVTQGLPKNIVANVLAIIKEQAKLELIRDHKLCYAETSFGSVFNEFIASFSIKFKVDLDNFDQDPAVLEELIKYLQINQNFIFYALEYNILPKIRVELDILEHNSNQHAYLYRSVQGISGTTDNYRSIDRMTFDQAKYIGTNGVTIDHIMHKNPEINQLSGDHAHLVAELLKKPNKKGRITHAIIDAGGLFTGVTNLDVARKIANQLKLEHSILQIKHVLFFNDQNQLAAIDIEQPNKLPIIIGSSDKDVIKKTLNCTEDNWFTYYDQRHTIGTDILQASTANAAITLSYDTTLTKFLQAAMRMRGLPKDQQLSIFVEPYIIKSCFNDITPTIDSIVNFLYKNDITALSEDHFRYVLQAMDNMLYQELLQILLEGEDEYNSTEQEKKAKIFNTVRKHSMLFIKKTYSELFKRYGGIEKDNIKLEDVLLEKKAALINLRRFLLEEINKIKPDLQVTEEGLILFEDKLDKLITLAKQNCKPEVAFRENIEQDSELETETQKELQIEAEQELEVVKIPQSTNVTHFDYDDWISESIQRIQQNPENISQFESHILNINTMMYLENIDLGFVAYDLYISKNHAYICKEQHDLFDQYRLPIQHILMIKKIDGTIVAIIITPNEAQQLIAEKGFLFAENEENVASMWLESPSGIVSYGVRSETILKDLAYCRMKEQIKFINGDLKSLLMDEQYLWLPIGLEHKRKLLERILISRPDQSSGTYAIDLFTKAEKLRRKYELVLIDLVRDIHTTKEEKMKSIVTELYNLSDLMHLKKTQPLIFAYKLTIILQDYPLDRNKFKSLQLNIQQQHVDLLVNTYKAKQLLIKIKENLYKKQSTDHSYDQKQFDSLIEKLKLMKSQSTNNEFFKTLLLESIIENNLELIEVICKIEPNILNDINYSFGSADEEIHPTIEAIQRRHYVLLDKIIAAYFEYKESTLIENSEWLKRCFSHAYEQKDFTLLSILINNANNIDIGIELERKIIVWLAENFKDDMLEKFCNVITEEHSAENLLLKKEVTSLANLLKKSAEEIFKFSNTISSVFYGEMEYDYKHPNFTISIGNNVCNQLMVACIKGDLEAYKKLLSNDGFSKNEKYNKYDILTYAMIGKNETIVLDLIRKNFPKIIENLTVDDINKILDQIINTVHPVFKLRLFNNEFLNNIIEHFIQYSLLSTQTKEFDIKLSKIFSLAIEEFKNYELAKKLINLAEVKEIDLLCICPNLLVELINNNDLKGVKLIIKYKPILLLKAGELIVSTEPYDPPVPKKEKVSVLPILQPITKFRINKKNTVKSEEIMDEIIIGLQSLSIEDKLANINIEFIIISIHQERYSFNDPLIANFVKKLLKEFDSPEFNTKFLSYYLLNQVILDFQLIEDLFNNIAVLSIENNKNLLFMLLDRVYSVENQEFTREHSQTINRIISKLLENCNVDEIQKALQEKTKNSNNEFCATIIYLLRHAKQHSDNQTLVAKLLTEYYPGNIELNGENLLLYAIKENNKELVDLLLSKGASFMDLMQNEDDKEDLISGFDILCCKSMETKVYGFFSSKEKKLYIDTFNEDSIVLLQKVIESEIKKLNVTQYMQYLMNVIKMNVINNGNLKMFDILIVHMDKFQQQINQINIKKLLQDNIISNFRSNDHAFINSLKIFYKCICNDMLMEHLNISDMVNCFKQILSIPITAKYITPESGKLIFVIFEKILDIYRDIITKLYTNDKEKLDNFIQIIKLCSAVKDVDCLKIQTNIMQAFLMDVENKKNSGTLLNMLTDPNNELAANFFGLPEELFFIVVDYLIASLPSEEEFDSDKLSKVFEKLCISNKLPQAIFWFEKFKLSLNRDERIDLFKKLIKVKNHTMKSKDFMGLIKIIGVEEFLAEKADLCSLMVDKENFMLIIRALLEDGILHQKELIINLIANKYVTQYEAQQEAIAAVRTAPITNSSTYSQTQSSQLAQIENQPNIISNLIHYILSNFALLDENGNVIKISNIMDSFINDKINSIDEFTVAKSIIAIVNSERFSLTLRSKSMLIFDRRLEIYKKQFSAIVNFPSWCANIFKYFNKNESSDPETVNFDKLSSSNFYKYTKDLFTTEEFKAFSQKFEQAVKLHYEQKNDSKSIKSKF